MSAIELGWSLERVTLAGGQVDWRWVRWVKDGPFGERRAAEISIERGGK